MKIDRSLAGRLQRLEAGEPSALQVARAAQADWYTSWSTGNDSNDGKTALTALKTLDELARRTRGIVPTVAGEITFHILDTSPAIDERLGITYARIDSGTSLRVKGTPSAITSGTVTTARAESTAGSGTARGLTVTAFNWATHATNGRRVYSPDLNAIAWIAKDEGSNTARITASYQRLGGYPYTLPLASENVDFSNGGNFTVQDLITTKFSVVQDIYIEGTILDGDVIDTQARLVLEDLEIIGNDFTVTDIFGGAGGNVVCWGCWFGFIYLAGPSNPLFYNCKFSSIVIAGGQVNFYGCLVPPAAFYEVNAGASVFHAFTHWQGAQALHFAGYTEIDTNSAIFDFGGDAFALKGPAATVHAMSGILYGSGNIHGVAIQDGAKFVWEPGQTPIVTGSGGDTTVDGATVTWAKTAPPYKDASSGSLLGQAGTSGGRAQQVGITSKSVQSGDVTLSLAEAMVGVAEATGTPGTARVFNYPNTIPTGHKLMLRNGSNAATTFKVTGQTGFSVAAGKTVNAYFNGTDLVQVGAALP